MKKIISLLLIMMALSIKSVAKYSQYFNLSGKDISNYQQEIITEDAFKQMKTYHVYSTMEGYVKSYCNMMREATIKLTDSEIRYKSTDAFSLITFDFYDRYSGETTDGFLLASSPLETINAPELLEAEGSKFFLKNKNDGLYHLKVLVYDNNFKFMYNEREYALSQDYTIMFNDKLTMVFDDPYLTGEISYEALPTVLEEMTSRRYVDYFKTHNVDFIQGIIGLDTVDHGADINKKGLFSKGSQEEVFIKCYKAGTKKLLFSIVHNTVDGDQNTNFEYTFYDPYTGVEIAHETNALDLNKALEDSERQIKQQKLLEQTQTEKEDQNEELREEAKQNLIKFKKDVIETKRDLTPYEKQIISDAIPTNKKIYYTNFEDRIREREAEIMDPKPKTDLLELNTNEHEEKLKKFKLEVEKNRRVNHVDRDLHVSDRSCLNIYNSYPIKEEYNNKKFETDKE